LRDRLAEALARDGLLAVGGRGLTYDQQISDGSWSAPETVELVWIEETDEAAIRWTEEGWGKETWTPVREFREDGQLFDHFVRLSAPLDGGEGRLGELRPEVVQDFARRYGIPLLCGEHRIPATGCMSAGEWGIGPCWPLEPLPVREVCRLSAQVRAILTLSVALRSGEPGPRKEWDFLYEEPYGLRLPDGLFDWRAEREDWQPGGSQLAWFLNVWLRFGNLRPSVDWGEAGPEAILFPVNSLWGAITRHLLLLLCGQRGLALCAGCAELFVPPHRKPKRGQNAWCRECGLDGGYRRAKAVSAANRRKGEDC
jgi:hypothetical protein